MAKYKIGDTLKMKPSKTDEEKHEVSSLFIGFHIKDMDSTGYIGYYIIKGFKKKFSITLDIDSVDNNSRFSLSLKKILKNL